MRRPVKIILGIVIGLSVLCVGAVLIFYFTNQSLPTHSKNPVALSDSDQGLYYEANHLRIELGGQVWPGWEQAKYIPFVAYNEAYAFLLGMADPPSGWTLPGKAAARGAAWEVVGGSNVHPAGYYRQPVQNAAREIGAFTVRIGETWVACLPTYEWYQIEFFNGMRQQFPPIVKDILPYALLRNTILGGSDRYITSQLHEAFHAYQSTVAYDRLLAAENAVRLEGSYPWDNTQSEQAWKSEIETLLKAVKSSTLDDAKSNTRQFLAQRQARRTTTSLSANLVDFERQREWLEGLAKYAELSSGHFAAQSETYKPLEAAGFKDYASYESFYNMQLDQVGAMTDHKEEVRFYYTGMAQAVLLDRLLPGWKDHQLKTVFLEDLLAEALQ